MKTTAEKSSHTTSASEHQKSAQPFFAKAGGGDFFTPVSHSSPSVQTKLTVNKPGDKFEQEADKMADKVMRMPAPAPPAKEEKIQRAALPEEKVQKKEEDKIQKATLPEEKVQKKEEEKIQKAALPEEKVQKKEEDKIQKATLPEEKVQKKEEEKIQKATLPEEKVQKKEEEKLQRDGGNGSPAVAADTQSSIRSKTSGGQPLSTEARSYMEPRFNADFSNVRIHSDPESAGLSNQLSARAFTYQNHVFFSRDQYQPGTSEGKQLLAHELTHTIQQGHAIQRSPQVTTTATPPPVQRLGIQDALDYFADKAYNLPGFRMLTIIMGFNPINMRSTDRSAANILRALIELVPGGHLITQALDNHGVFTKAGAWVEQQLSTLGNIGADIVTGLKRFIDSLSWTDIFDLGGVWNRAVRIFTDPIGRLISFAQSVVSGILKMVKDAILKPLAALAQGTRGYDLLKAILGEDPITGEAVPRNADTLIGGFMKLIGQEEVWENIKKGNAIGRAWAWFQGALAGLMGFVRAIPRRIVDTISSLTFQDIITVVGALSKIIGAFVNIAGEFISWGLNQVISLLEILFSVVAPGVMPYIAKARAAFTTIIKNPIGFVNNLVRAGKLGFEKFASNILTHLKTALIKWITGPLGDAGVYIPKSFSLMEIIKLVLSVLGLTWQNIRSKLVKIIPEPVLVVLEKTAGILVTLVTEGPAAAWEQIKTELSELKDQMIAKITEMISTEVVKAAIMKLVSMLNPAGAVIQAIIAIYNTVTFFIQKINQIAAVVASFIDSIVAIASGQVENAAKKVEQTMANTLTIIIAFLAKFAGLGNIPEKIVGIIRKIRQPIDKGLDKIVGWLGGMLKKLMGKDKKDERTVEQKNSDLQKGLAEGEAMLTVPTPDIEKIRRSLPAIKDKYKLSVLELKEESNTEEEETVYIYGEVNPKDSKPKHRVKKGGADSIISEADLNFDRFKWKPDTKKQLRKLHAGSKNIMDSRGTFKSPTKWHRRHVVAWGDMKRHFVMVFSNKTVKEAVAILTKEGVSVAKMERTAVVQQIKALARKAFNEVDNLFIDLGKENSSLQDVLDTANPAFLDDKGKIAESKIDKKVADFIAKHAIGGHSFSVNTEVGVVDWEVTYAT